MTTEQELHELRRVAQEYRKALDVIALDECNCASYYFRRPHDASPRDDDEHCNPCMARRALGGDA